MAADMRAKGVVPSRASWLAVVLMTAVAASAAHAQVRDERPVRRVEIGVGAGLLGGAVLGATDANLRANTRPPQDFRLFSTDTRFDSAPFAEVRAGVALTRRIGAEARLVFGQPELRTSIRADVEMPGTVAAVERVDQYLVEASVLFMLDELRLGPIVPFVAGGAGYLRQLHEGRTVVEEGRVYHVGGGVKYWMFARQRGVLRGAGLRADARWHFLVGGYDFERRARPHGALAGGLFVTF